MSTMMKRRILIASATGLIGIALPATALGQRCGRVAVPSRGRAGSCRARASELSGRAPAGERRLPRRGHPTLERLPEPLRRVLARRWMALLHRPGRLTNLLSSRREGSRRIAAQRRRLDVLEIRTTRFVKDTRLTKANPARLERRRSRAAEP
jgi:hypothetical protein